MTVKTIADISTTGPISATAQLARWAKITASAAACRVGDTNVGAARGDVLASGVPYELPLDGSDPTSYYDLNQVNVYVASGSISVTYGL